MIEIHFKKALQGLVLGPASVAPQGPGDGPDVVVDFGLGCCAVGRKGHRGEERKKLHPGFIVLRGAEV